MNHKIEFWKINIKQIFWLTKIFIFWRITLFIFAWVGIKLLPFKFSFPYVEETLKPYGSTLFWSWANFDGVHYLGIAQKGYFAQYTQAFFPLYPLIVRWLNSIFGNFLFTGLLVSHLCFLGALFFLYKLLMLDYKEKIVRKAIIFLVFFPTSFFFGSFYTESLFLLLTLGSFYFARQKQWFYAGFFGLFASLTRLIGVLLLPALLWEWYEYVKKKRISFRNYFSLLFLILPCIGLGIYMDYLQKNFSDSLYFLHAQPAFGASRSADKIVLLYQVFYRYIRMIFISSKDTFLYFTINLEFLSALIFLILLIMAFKKNIRTSYIIFSSLAYILPTLTGTFSSMPRYVLVLFPCFIVLGLIKSRFKRIFLFLLQLLLLFISTLLFTRGYWIA